MQSVKIQYPPFVRANDSTSKVMFDVILALIPCLVFSYFAFGFVPVMVILVAVGSALLTEFIFSMIFWSKKNSVTDGSGIVTGILLSCTIGAFTPLYVVAFGGAMSVLFGKLLWGGLGRNPFNPALVGREFMTVFFPTVMTSGSIWYDRTAVNLSGINLFDNELLNGLFFRPSGAIGEYSILFLTLGGLYLLFRRRISWHIPFALFAAFSLPLYLLLYLGNSLSFSLGGLMLGAIFMATDMPSSPSTSSGKIFYGAMIGLTAILFILNGVNYEYMSYSILLLNAFTAPVNWVFRPRIWGRKLDWSNRLGQGVGITAGILLAAYAIAYLHQIGGIQYLLYVYIAFCIIRFNSLYIRKRI
ncbi:RnfABCDGE type electron transport complex subunit D [Parabacteroides sp. Marseille-P3160]|uniref:RnfABCDGE type electron transport complex subunit D n=1 Tax=Parabacteroides sp. Marseille-P3160 TaxID=1917887 RepID=UPI0009BA2C80|nr:RnfABCDGE type electron transport complex subunit D [Parabacteroides sp. Marseille-P3160]